MLLNSSNRVEDNGKDYLLLVDYGSEGISVFGQYETLDDAIKGQIGDCYSGSTMVVKLCRVDINETP